MDLCQGKPFVLGSGTGLWGVGQGPGLRQQPWGCRLGRVILGQEGHSLREGAGGLTSSPDAYLSRTPEGELGLGWEWEAGGTTPLSEAKEATGREEWGSGGFILSSFRAQGCWPASGPDTTAEQLSEAREAHGKETVVPAYVSAEQGRHSCVRPRLSSCRPVSWTGPFPGPARFVG